MSSTATSPKPLLHGVIAAMLTPMRDAGTRVDVEAATRLVSRLVDRGVHGLYVAGTTGEGLYLTADEHRELARAVVKAARGVPVVVHVGALTTAQAVALARQAVQAEATAVAAIPPPYYSLTRDELLAYFTAIAKAAEPLPLYLYNIPSHARNELPPAFAAECGRRIPSIRGIKDSSGVAGRIPDLVKTLGPGFDVVCGNDDKVLHAFQSGAAGIVASGASIFPELYLEVHAFWKAGRRRRDRGGGVLRPPVSAGRNRHLRPFRLQAQRGGEHLENEYDSQRFPNPLATQNSIHNAVTIAAHLRMEHGKRANHEAADAHFHVNRSGDLPDQSFADS